MQSLIANRTKHIYDLLASFAPENNDLKESYENIIKQTEELAVKYDNERKEKFNKLNSIIKDARENKHATTTLTLKTKDKHEIVHTTSYLANNISLEQLYLMEYYRYVTDMAKSLQDLAAEQYNKFITIIENAEKDVESNTSIEITVQVQSINTIDTISYKIDSVMESHPELFDYLTKIGEDLESLKKQYVVEQKSE
jgi:hypothetical protein